MIALNDKKKLLRKILKELLATIIEDINRFIRPFRFISYIPSKNKKEYGKLNCILINGGYGYGNVGDEAQLSSNIERWKKKDPQSKITVLSPHPQYTSEYHKISSKIAPRVIWFNSNKRAYYWFNNPYFYFRFFLIAFRHCISANLIKLGFPISFTSKEETNLLLDIKHASILHISGGGFLTGMTRSRLWENMLLLRIAHILKTPSILTGQTIGVFKSLSDKIIAYWGLSTAQSIKLRDKNASENDLKSIRLFGSHIASYYDDALFCKTADKETVYETLKKSEIDPLKPYFIVNYHFWGMTDKVKKDSQEKMSNLIELIGKKEKLQVLFLPMTPSDIAPLNDLKTKVNFEVKILSYEFDFKIARGVISHSECVFAMKHHPIIFAYGESIPVLSVCLDDYYYRKNKGAMSLVGQEKYCMDQNEFFSDQSKKITEEFISKRYELKNLIDKKIKEYHKLEKDILPDYFD